jgi:Na+-driven multidrug efflux pump
VPAVVSSASRLLSFVLPVLWLSRQPDFAMIQVWYMSVASVALQAVFSLWLVRRELRLRLTAAPQTIPA